MNIYPVLLYTVVPAWQVLWTCLVFAVWYEWGGVGVLVLILCLEFSHVC